MTNEIYYLDFEPQVIDKNFWGTVTFENNDVVMQRVNDWVRKNYNREIINVETMILPKSTNSSKNLNVSKINMHSGIVHMIQTIRIWYK
jgi:hypothetical protein